MRSKRVKREVKMRIKMEIRMRKIEVKKWE